MIHNPILPNIASRHFHLFPATPHNVQKEAKSEKSVCLFVFIHEYKWRLRLMVLCKASGTLPTLGMRRN